MSIMPNNSTHFHMENAEHKEYYSKYYIHLLSGEQVISSKHTFTHARFVQTFPSMKIALLHAKCRIRYCTSVVRADKDVDVNEYERFFFGSSDALFVPFLSCRRRCCSGNWLGRGWNGGRRMFGGRDGKSWREKNTFAHVCRSCMCVCVCV